MRTLTMGFYRAQSAAEAVARAFGEEGVRSEHVAVQPLEGERGAWRWWLRPGAPLVTDGEVTTFDVVEAGGSFTTTNRRHPPIERGVVLAVEARWLVVSGDGAERDLVLAGRESVLDLGRMGGVYRP